MKKTKITAVIVAVCILLTTIACTVTAGAEVTNSQGKLSPQLVEGINTSADETICVYISLLPCTGEAEIEKAVSEKYTWSDDNEYLKYYRQELSSVVGAYVQKFVDDHGDLLNRILVQPNSSEFVIAEVSKGNVEELAKLDIVHDIDVWYNEEDMPDDEMDEDDSFLNKVSDGLSIKMNGSDPISIYISLKPCTSEAEIEKIVREKYTWATEDEYLSYYRRELSNVVGAYVHEFIDNNSELLGEIIMIPNCVEFVIVKTSKDFIIELAKQDIVSEIDYWDEMSESNDDEFDSFYQNAFIDWSVFKYGKECFAEGYRYDELYKHFTEDENDWVLIDAEYFLDQPAVETWIHIGGRKIFSGSLCAPFKCCYGIYDVKENCFYDLDELSDNYSKYAGLIETLETLEIGKPTGDANLDNTVSISDVTCIQRMLAEYDQFTKYQNGLSDVNKDSKVNIADATDIQRYSAQLITDFDR